MPDMGPMPGSGNEQLMQIIVKLLWCGVLGCHCLCLAMGFQGARKAENDVFSMIAQAEAKDVGTACTNSCQSACKSGISDFVAYSQKFSGLALAAGEEERVMRSCTRRCIYECKKPADLYQFEVSNRR